MSERVWYGKGHQLSVHRLPVELSYGTPLYGTIVACNWLLGRRTHSRILQLINAMAHTARSKCVRTTVDTELMAQAAANLFNASFLIRLFKGGWGETAQEKPRKEA